MGIVVTIASGKGGTGKTSLTGGIAAFLAEMGRRVLCIDMDIGLRNLDLSLGLNNRACMDFSDVALEHCDLERAVIEHPDLNGLYLLTAPMSRSPALTTQAFQRVLELARTRYDYIFLDAPSGFGPGFHLAVCDVDRVFIVATQDAASLRDAQRTVLQLESIPQIHLIMNRIQPLLLNKLHITLDDAMNTVGLPLIGVVPEDTQITLCANRGLPLPHSHHRRRGAARACRNIAQRLEGHSVPILRIPNRGWR